MKQRGFAYAPLGFRMALVLGMLALAGCGGSSAKVKGRVTCDSKPVVGLILFSPKGEEGERKSADLKDDGSYELQFNGTGKYTIVITPRDVVANPKPGEFPYPCDLAPLERDIKAGDNEIIIELSKRTR